MLRYIVVRIAATIPSLLGVSLVIFTLLRFIPGDPAYTILLSMLEPGAGAAELARANLDELRGQLGLNDPYPVQYLTWLGNVARGNLGASFRSRAPITGELAARFPATLELTAAALAVALLIALPTGILGAIYHGRAPDYAARLASLTGVSLPSFFLGLALMYLFAVKLGWLPAIGRGTPAHLALPALTLGAGVAAAASRLLRASLLDVLSQPYILTAEAKGMPRRVILFKHALRPALLPVLTSFGLLLGGLLGGSVIVETVFSWPGVGRYVVDAIAGRDYPVIQGFALLMSLVYVTLNLVVDILYRLLDPRVRVEGALGD